MASDAVPAAAPNPDDAASAPTTNTPGDDPKGLLGSLLTPVPAARSATFNIDPDINGINQDTAVQGASSSSYHPDGNNPQGGENNGKGNSATRQETGVIKAWLLAGAERWRKGGDARLKALDIKKARAQALQVKESRNVNRSEKIIGGAANNGTNSLNSTEKSLGSKTNNRTGKHDSASGTKHPSNTSAKNAPAGRSKADSGGSSTSTNREAAAPEKPAHRTGPGVRAAARDRASDRIRNGPGAKASESSKDGKGKDRSAGAKGSKGDGSGKPGAQGPAGKPGKDASAQTSSAQSGKGDSGKKGSGSGRDDKQADADRVTLGKAVASEAGDRLNNRLNARRADLDQPVISRHKGTKGDNDDTPKDPDSKKTSLTKDGRDGTAKQGDKGADSGTPKETSKPEDPKSPAAKGTAPADKKAEPDEAAKGADTAKAKDTHGKPWTTQPAREAGYRDGARAARVAAQAQAYRDGTKDGWNDVTGAAKREKARLDKAHAARQKERDKPNKPKDQTVNATSADYHKPRPIEVTGIDAKEIHLGAGALKPSVSRGEVRNFVTFIARLEEKSTAMQKAAESTKALQTEAETQADEVTELLEDAKGVKGGDKLIAKLERLADAAKTQSSKAAEARKRAVRAADACKALAANVKTRYEPIFKAVVDSPETRPAEMKFYRDHGYTTAA